MADEIIQELGFDASKALEALEKMNSGLGSFENQLKSVAEAMSTWNSSAGATVTLLKEIGTSAVSAAEAMGKLAGAFATPPHGPAAQPLPAQPAVPPPTVPQLPPVTPVIDSRPIREAQQHVQNFVMTWQTMGRVVTTQLLVRAMSMARDAIREAMDSNIQFVRSMTELQAISPEKNMGTLTEAVKKLSVEFNVPLKEVVEAQYQAISNQFASTAQAADIMTAAVKISKIGMVDAGKAAEIIAGTLNTFGLDSSQAEQVAAKLFGTIQTGHLRFGELASIMSRAGATAKELGISLDELLAAAAALSTSGGMKSSEVATALRASMTALVKPSHDLAAELRDVGLSAEQLTTLQGLVGTWRDLRSQTDGTISSLAKFGPNVRGLNAELIETSEKGGKAFVTALKGVEEMASRGLNVPVKLARSTDVEKLTSEFNKLQVFLTTDFGAGIVKAANHLMELTGGANNLIAVIKGLEAPVAVAATAFGLLAGKILLVKGNAILAEQGLSLLAKGANLAAGAAMAYGTGVYLAESFARAQQEAMEALDRIQRERREAAKAADAVRDAEQLRANEQTVHAALEAVAKVQAAYAEQIKAGQQANQDWKDQTKIALDSLVSAKEHGVRLLKDLANEANREIESSTKRTSEMTGQLEDVRYRWKEMTGESAAAQEDAAAHRAMRLAMEGEAALAKSRSKDEEEAAQNIFKRAEGFAQEAMSAAKTAKDLGLQEDAERAIERVLRMRLEGEEALRSVKSRQADEAARAAAEEEAKVGRMRELAKEILKDSSLYDAKGQPLSDRQRAERLQRVRQEMDEFSKLAFSGGKWQVSDLLNFAGFRERIETAFKSSVTNVQIQGVSLATTNLETLNRQISKGIGVVPVLVELTPDKSKLKGLTVDQAIQETTKQLQAQEQSVKNLVQKKENLADLDRQMADAAEQINRRFELQGSTISKVVVGIAAFFSRNPFGSDDMQKFKSEWQQVAGFQKEIKADATDLNFGMKEYANLVDRVTKGWQASTNTTLIPYKSIADVLGALKTIAEAHDKLKAEPSVGNLDAQIKAAEEKLNSLKQQSSGAGQDVQGVNNKVSDVSTGIGSAKLAMAGFRQEIENAITAMGRLATAAWSVPAPGEEMTAAKGGMAFLAGGGRPRGTDVIPAMLSPGEMVMSAATTRRFASTLTAMNAGVRPSHHLSQGGHVTSIGDITFNGGINVAGGNTGRQTARAIATELRREIRRGTSVL